MKLSIKIISVFLLISLITFSLLIFFNIQTFSKNLENSYISKAKTTAYSLDSIITSKDSFIDNENLLLSFNKFIWLEPDILSISAIELKQDTLIKKLSTNPKFELKNIDKYQETILFEKMIYNISKEDQTLIIISPIHISGEIIGAFEIEMTLEKIYEDIDNEIFKFTTLSILSVLFISICLILVINFFVLGPIKKISDTTIEIANGKLDIEYKVKTKDELGNLGTSFNFMRTEIKKLKENLESQVKLKTKELAERIADLEKIRDLTSDSEIYAEKMRIEKEEAWKNIKILEKELVNIKKDMIKKK